MATKKITDLTLLTQPNSAAGDVLPIVDISDGASGTTKKITLTSLKSGSFSGSFEGDGSGLPGVISSSYALTASYELIKEVSSSHANVADIATVEFANSVWGSPTPATFDAAYGVIYNTSTSPVNKLVVVLDFSGTKSCSNGTFTVTFPAPTSGSPSGADALLSIKSN